MGCCRCPSPSPCRAARRHRPGPGRFATIAYHAIGEDGRDKHYSIAESMLVQHVSFLRQDGWHFIGIDALLAAPDGRRPLPDKVLLLSFDDGYDDYATRVFPLLHAVNVPAVVALVTSWMETPANGTLDYGGTPTPRRGLITWAQARAMQASRLCEFASHTHDLHHGVPANPQGDVKLAVVTRNWNGVRYETDAKWKRRIETDLARASTILARELGSRPRCMMSAGGPRTTLPTMSMSPGSCSAAAGWCISNPTRSPTS
ncbi:hypothetical protein GCM10011320_38660 [Neoroseomonas lacus]|uniref:Chitooligosaccharide deacetylase n=1 Tax=Neoroseomonas lacus TaxID=287609 RepID=A0A917KSC0_9PROT|nr:polysaccharide deacetylase family protein [Neoroseomonas lacus]GGJ27665.1 hypothetical protein GCM10011320_38660 [Neoroseomonas lacus]